jgi:protein-disulfide isomerase
MFQFVLLSLALIVLSVHATTQTFIPLDKNDYAFHRGNLASKVNVEFYIDLTCSSCLEEWPTLTQVYETYKNSVHFYYRLFPLPYHQQGFIVNKAAHVVNYYGKEDAVFTFFDNAFNNQAQIYNSATYDSTYRQVVDLVSAWAVNGTGVTVDQYNVGMNSSYPVGQQLEMATRYMWKYTTIHQVFATPTFVVNGLMVGGLESFEDWQKTLDALIV